MQLQLQTIFLHYFRAKAWVYKISAYWLNPARTHLWPGANFTQFCGSGRGRHDVAVSMCVIQPHHLYPSYTNRGGQLLQLYTPTALILMRLYVIYNVLKCSYNSLASLTVLCFFKAQNVFNDFFPLCKQRFAFSLLHSLVTLNTILSQLQV